MILKLETFFAALLSCEDVKATIALLDSDDRSGASKGLDVLLI